MLVQKARSVWAVDALEIMVSFHSYTYMGISILGKQKISKWQNHIQQWQYAAEINLDNYPIFSQDKNLGRRDFLSPYWH